MKVEEITRQKVFCSLNENEIKEVRQTAKRLRPNYDGYRYVDLILGSYRGGFYKIQKFVFRETFGKESNNEQHN